MDMVTLAMAKKYTDQKAGYSETPAFNYDGNGENLVFDLFHKVSDTAYDLSKLEKIHLVYTSGETAVLTADQFTVVEAEGGKIAMSNDGQSNPYAVAMEAGTELAEIYDDSGTLVAHSTVYYVSRIEFAETIHTIDPKYLPGVCLPVVELSTHISSEDVALTAEESEQLAAALAQGVPCVIRFAYGANTIPMSCVFNIVVDGVAMYAFAFGSMQFITGDSGDGTWAFSMIISE